MTDILDRLPYARFLGLEAMCDGQALTVTMPFADRLIGNPMLPALHGGATAALLELTAIAQVAVIYPRLRLPRPINVSVAYLRSGRPADVKAIARIGRAGRRVAHVLAEAWQDDPRNPIAALTAHFLIAGDDS
ncbi:MAG TPA: PaaI family thioesterase [Brevundimonas sp.]|nr:PaaI family thioesterase [Brevundimonas sp.]